MKKLKILANLFALLAAWQGWGQAVAVAYNPDEAFFRARSLAFEGHREQARDTLMRILSDYPDYTDVQSLLAKTYSWDGDYDKARLHFNRITSRNRTQEEAWVGAIRNEMYAGNTSLALGLANKALSYLESSPEIEAIRQEILDASGAGAGERGGGDAENAEEAENLLALASWLEVFDTGYDPMFYSSLEYQRATPLGKVVPRLNYSDRFDTRGMQYELDLYPILSKTFHGYLNYGYSSVSTFPNHRVGAELYANLGRGHEASLGMRYLDFRESTASLLTASYGWYRGNYYVSLRPFVTLAKDRSPGVSGSMLARRYFRDKHQYLGIRGIYGFSPELRQLWSGSELLAETLLFVESQQVLVEYQFAGTGARNRYRAELGVGRQEFVLESGSFYWVFQAGVRYMYGF